MGQVGGLSDKPVKLGDPRLNVSREIPPEAAEGAIFDHFSNVDNFRPEVESDVIFGAVVDPHGMRVCVKLCDSRSHRSRDIRLLNFVTNDDTGKRRSSHDILPNNRHTNWWGGKRRTTKIRPKAVGVFGCFFIELR